MNRTSTMFAFALLSAAGSTAVCACEYKPGETRFLDYANCRYGSDSIQVVELPEGSAWQHCFYQLQAFRPANLLAVTKDQDGVEVLSICDRSKIGNPCYMAKQACDQALKAFDDSQY